MRAYKALVLISATVILLLIPSFATVFMKHIHRKDATSVPLTWVYVQGGSDTDGAEVWIDNYRAGRMARRILGPAPCECRIRLQRGKYRVCVRKAGHADYCETLHVEGVEVYVFVNELPPIAGPSREAPQADGFRS